MSSATQLLGEEIRFPGGKVAPNRFLKSAMTERLCAFDETKLDERGKPLPGYIHLYEEWGAGQIGTIVLGNIPVHREHLEAKGNAIIDRDSKAWDPVEGFKPVIKACKAHGSLVIGQLTAGGRQVPKEVNPNPIAPSETQNPDVLGMTFGKARAMTVDEIHDFVDRWAYAAEVLYKAGADGAQIHCAHGYLISSYMSPRVNKRTDQYGGSLENRSRIIFEIVDEIKRRVPDPSFIISIKYNSHDFIDGGFSEEDSQQLAKMMDEAGVQLIELSGGTYEQLAFDHKKESTKKREAFFLEFAERLRPFIKTAKLCVTGGFRSIGAMADAVTEGNTQLVGLGRPLVWDLDFCKQLLEGTRTEARDNKVPDGLQLPACYIQLGEVGQFKKPTDLSVQENADAMVQKVKGGKEPSRHNAGGDEKEDRK